MYGWSLALSPHLLTYNGGRHLLKQAHYEGGRPCDDFIEPLYPGAGENP